MSDRLIHAHAYQKAVRRLLGILTPCRQVYLCVTPGLLCVQEPEAWEILRDCEEIADEYKTR